MLEPYLTAPSTSGEYSGAPGAIFTPHPPSPTTHDPRARRTAWSVAADYMPGPCEAPSFGKTERGKNKHRNKKWRMSFDTKEVGDGREN